MWHYALSKPPFLISSVTLSFLPLPLYIISSVSDSAILPISRVSLHLVFLLLLPCFLSSRLFSFVIRLLLCFYLYLPVSLHPSLATISPSYSFTHITFSLLFSTSPSFLPFSPHLSLSISHLISLACHISAVLFPSIYCLIFHCFPLHLSHLYISISVPCIIFTHLCRPLSLSFALRLHILITLHAAREIFVRATILQREADV